ncbi:MAG: hypothetical protein ACK6CE_06110 [Planctomycetota bacterium]
MNWLVDYLLLLGTLLLPAVLFALAIHALDHLIQGRLARQFGWRAVLWTGWLGTPVHEFSHAIACWIFQHRVDEIRLFDPDLEEGRLGYVRHSYRRGNLYQEIGNVFIGTAPLLGGSVVLVLLTWLFFPAAIRTAFDAARQLEFTSLSSSISQLLKAASSSLGVILDPENLLKPRLWVFCYFVLCIASHMAPSRTDYAGSLRGAVLLLALLAIASIGISAAGGSPQLIAWSVLQAVAPLWGVALLALAICCLAAVLVVALTALF